MDMKNLLKSMKDFFILKKSAHKYIYHPKTKKELQDIIIKLMHEQSTQEVIDLNSIDTSRIIDMSELFYQFEGLIRIDVTDWDVSRVNSMEGMFMYCINLEKIIGIESWDISNVTDMRDMFYGTKFNGGISNFTPILKKVKWS